MLNLFIALSIVLATWLGGAPLSQIFSVGFVGIFVMLYIVLLLGVRLSRFFRRPAYGVMIFFFFIGMAYFTGSAFKYVFNDMPTYKVTQNVPVALDYVRNEGRNTGSVLVTNLNNDPMTAVGIACKIFYDNGNPVDATFTGGFGSLAQMSKGVSKATHVVDGSAFIRYRSNPDQMQCVVTDATFVKSPTYNIALKFEKNMKDFKTDFYVTNNDVVALKNIQFQCTTSAGRAKRVQAYPAYLTDARKETIIGVNETVKFVSEEAVWDYSSCFVSNAIAG